MRRLKRDPLERAFLRGYQYGISGKSRELCPFTLPSVRQAWLNGWREGRGDNWDGMTGTAGIHRLNELHAVGSFRNLPTHHARSIRAAGASPGAPLGSPFYCLPSMATPSGPSLRDVKNGSQPFFIAYDLLGSAAMASTASRINAGPL